ncbi:Sensory transduction histidine kinase [Methanosarcina barkeri str. Wiesmoor]|uniref:Sensory transduction histidine kinase n=2 Tax=Methanosarcina barkeri TaxID=2208 RepID=A0A0E3LLD0_METBA|nr:PAS domain S-box protein [Methanosarcina barkeri]AKB51056.1 Sensory transduction histidine kinase [Methanosarcina barkeri str. Wiesmoor]
MENEENWMAEFILNSPGPVLRIGKKGTVLYANKTGKSLLEALNSRIGEKAPDEILKPARRVVIQKIPAQTELKVDDKIYSIIFTPLLAFEGTILSAFEVTSLKQAKEKLLFRQKKYKVLSQISELSLKTSDFQALLDQTLPLVATAVGAEYCSVLKLLPDGDFIFETGVGWKPENIGRIIKKDSASRAGYTVLSSRTIMLEKLDKNNSIRTMGLEENQDIISGISVLMGTVEKPYGVLMAHSTKKEKFFEENACFLSATAVIFSFVIQRKKVEAALQDKVYFLETLLDTIPALVFYKDRKGIYQGCNELFAKMILGSSKERIAGHSIYDLFKASSPELEDIPELEDAYERMDKQLFQKGGSHAYEAKVVCSDGLRRDFIFNKAIYKSFCGTVEGLIGVMLDITGRKKTEEKLQKSEERYRIIAEQTGQLIYDIDLKNGLVEWAGAVNELTGYSNKEIENLDFYDWLEHIHSEDYRRVQQTLKNCWNTGEKFNEEFRFKRKDGSYIFVKNKGVYLRDDEDFICRALGVMEDVTEIKQSSEKLRESEELYRSFLQNFKGISFKLGPDFTPLLMQGAVEEITGYIEDDLTSGRIKLIGLINPEDMKMLEKSMEKMNSSPNSIREYDYRLKRKDGSVRWIHELIHNVCNASGETMFIQGYAYDITQRKKAEETLEKAEKIGMRETHHRIKNNLQIVSSMLSLQADKFKDKEVIEAFRESENRVISMSIIHEELYKSEDVASIDFAAYLRKLTADILHSYRIGNEKVKLILEVDSTLFGVDTAIPLGIIINELFSNSLKYAFPKDVEGKIRISLSRNDVECQKTGEATETNFPELPSSFTLVYSDNGGYFPEKVDFKNSKTLGLQLVNALVEQINGTIELERGNETKYTIRFEDK